MTFDTFLDIAFGVLAFVGGWAITILRQSLSDLQQNDAMLADKVQRIEVLVAGEYVKKSEFERSIAAIFAKLDRIEDKLDRKLDKADHE